MQMRGTPVTRASLPGCLGSEALHCEGTWGCFPEVERNRPLASPTIPCWHPQPNSQGQATWKGVPLKAQVPLPQQDLPPTGSCCLSAQPRHQVPRV